MKKNLLLLSFLSLILIFTSCKKEKKNTEISDHPEIPAHADDQSQFSVDLDESLNEITASLETNTNFSGRFQNLQSLSCDADVQINTDSNPRTITINYSGSNCNTQRTRTGKIIISMAQGVQWKNAGATVTVEFQNLKITRTRDGKSISLNGTYSYTNVSGGLIINMPAVNNITHRMTATGLAISVDNGTAALWNVKKQRFFNYGGGVIISTTGFHTEGGNSSIAIWGTNRYNRTFTTSIKQPLVFRQSCDFRLTSGEVDHRTNAYLLNTKFGLDSNGVATTCPGAAGNYYAKASWYGPHQVFFTKVFPY